MMPIMNYCTCPKADRKLTTWTNMSATVNSDGTRTYTGTGGSLNPFNRIVADFPFDSAGSAVGVIKFKEGGYTPSGCDVIRDGSKDGVWVMKIVPQDHPFWSPHWFPSSQTPLTPLALAVYTPQDWERLQSLGIVLFDGDTMPLA